ncbi:phage integrase central domain-containing protein, partial [Escherichia coli]|uniref:phage integrase central domain-containing protein n=1 Tax=Escherichia coli TaxID=562 RepID=UPI0028FC43EB|nr:integrase [Escherichia coli]
LHAASIAETPIDLINTEMILEVLQPIWMSKAGTARKLRTRLEQVLDAAKIAGHRSGENPARWRAHLAHLLPKQPQLQKGHHPALPYEQ